MISVLSEDYFTKTKRVRLKYERIYKRTRQTPKLKAITTRRLIMKILKGKEQDYKDWYNKNSDPYGHACFTYAERWAEMLENAIENSPDEPMKVILDNADELSREADTEGITGFMYGMAVSILSQCWEYGEELRKWHNKEYNYEGDG